MTEIVLDTNTLNYALKGHELVLARLDDAAERGRSFLLAPVAHFELTRYLDLKGATRLRRLYDSLVVSWRPCELTFGDWTEGASLWAERHRIGRSISDFDLLFAVLARKHKATLVTHNIRHFQGLGIDLEDWTAEENAGPQPMGR